MPIRFYADVHVPGPVILQLRLRGVDILAATEEQTNELPDEQLLERAALLKRIMILVITHIFSTSELDILIVSILFTAT